MDNLMPTKRRPRNVSHGDPVTVSDESDPDQVLGEAIAHAVLLPSNQAACTVFGYNKPNDDISLHSLADDLAALCVQVKNGDLSRAETMLISQAHSLDAIFNSLARRAMKQEYISNLETYLRLGLKAQSQCRATLEALAAIKNPQPVAFVRQANIAHGPQQVNNATVPLADSTRASETESQQNKLLGDHNGERLDSGATGATGSNGSLLEAVGAIDRSANQSRQRANRAKC